MKECAVRCKKFLPRIPEAVPLMVVVFCGGGASPTGDLLVRMWLSKIANSYEYS